MVVGRLRLRDFRSYEDAQVDVGERLTVIHGPNGAGKTNLVEGLFFACTSSSCRTANERELVRFGAPAARAEIDVRTADGDHVLAVGYEPGEPKRLTADGAPVQRLADVPFKPLVCVFVPDRMELVKGAPALRRAHLDQLVAALWPARASARREFAQALAQRNALLTRVRAGISPRAALDTWDLELGRHALALRDARGRAIDLVAPLATPLARDIGLAGELVVRYRPRSLAGSPEEFAAELAERLDGDLERGFTGHGPHRDELVLVRDGRELRVFGSQGEQRLALLALLVAEREVLARERDMTPLLLLDDVMSELDPGRRTALLERVAGEGQCVVTSADLEHVPAPTGVSAMTLAVTAGGVRVEEHA